jgi:hypothetical protein
VTTQEALDALAEEGWLEAIKDIICSPPAHVHTEWDGIVLGAARGGHEDIVDYCITRRGPERLCWLPMIEQAAERGNANVILLCERRGSTVGTLR